MLDAPIIENGVVRGVVCGTRRGTAGMELADISFVVSVANLITTRFSAVAGGSESRIGPSSKVSPNV